MKFSNGQLIYPENFRNPSFTISPFSTENLQDLQNIEKGQEIDSALLTNFFGQHQFTMSGKDAIYTALSFFKLQPDDEVYIVTTTYNTYVSSCVTNEIEKYCRWSRQYSEHSTKLIFIVHEFGTVCREVSELKKLGLPIIEDYAMSMFSGINIQRKQLGDFSVYSLPKFFPVQFGGVLRCNSSERAELFNVGEPKNFQSYLQKIVTHYLQVGEEIIDRRKENYRHFEQILNELNLAPRLELKQDEVPSVYMFSTEEVDLDGLKIFLQRHGIECSKFYGENSFFLPVHQQLSCFDIEYITKLIKYFINEDRKHQFGKGCNH